MPAWVLWTIIGIGGGASAGVVAYWIVRRALRYIDLDD